MTYRTFTTKELAEAIHIPTFKVWEMIWDGICFTGLIGMVFMWTAIW